MNVIYEAVRLLHFAAGALALVLFWVPAFTRKGGRTHRRAGRIYVWAMSIVVATAMPLSASFFFRGDWVIGTFLGYLGVITFTALWAGRAALNYKADAAAFRTPFHAAVGVMNAVAALIVLALAWTVAPPGFARTLLTIFPLIGLSAAWSTRRFFQRPPTDRRWWWYEHLGGMIGTGIAAHTAFGAFGMRQLFPELQLGPWALVPWIAPSLIGTIATQLLTRHYQRKFAAPAAVARTAETLVGS